jgi:hypothetical protein
MVVWLLSLGSSFIAKEEDSACIQTDWRHGVVDGHFIDHKPYPTNAIWERFRMGEFSSGAYRP